LIALCIKNIFKEKIKVDTKKPTRTYRLIRFAGVIIIVGYILVYLLILLDDTQGKMLKYDESHAIYYSKEYFDPSYIREIGNMFYQINFFSQDNAIDVQILRSIELGDTVSVCYVIDQNKLTQDVKEAFKEITRAIYPLLRTHTKIVFKNEKFNMVDQILLD
jgi:hypothetical protein